MNIETVLILKFFYNLKMFKFQDGPYVGPSGIAYALLHASKTNVGINVEKEALVILSKQQKLLHVF